MHGRPSWGLAPYDSESERTEDISPRGELMEVSTECCLMNELESVEWFVLSPSFCQNEF